MNILDFEAYLRNHLTPKRFEHSIRVMNTMEELAQRYSLDKRQAIAAGLLHDIAKELPADRWAAIASRDPLLSSDVHRYDYDHYLHGPVGAILLESEFGVMDQEILGAVATHGYYGPWVQFDRPLAWCLRMADLLEPGRNWSNSIWFREIMDPLREAVYGGHLMEGASIVTNRLIAWYEDIGLAVHPNIRQTANGASTRSQD